MMITPHSSTATAANSLNCCVYSPCKRFIVSFRCESPSTNDPAFVEVYFNIKGDSVPFSFSSTVERLGMGGDTKPHRHAAACYHVAEVRSELVRQITKQAGLEQSFESFMKMMHTALTVTTTSTTGLRFFVETYEEMTKRVLSELAKKKKSNKTQGGGGNTLQQLHGRANSSDDDNDEDDGGNGSTATAEDTPRFLTIDYRAEFVQAIFPIPLVVKQWREHPSQRFPQPYTMMTMNSTLPSTHGVAEDQFGGEREEKGVGEATPLQWAARHARSEYHSYTPSSVSSAPSPQHPSSSSASAPQSQRQYHPPSPLPVNTGVIIHKAAPSPSSSRLVVGAGTGEKVDRQSVHSHNTHPSPINDHATATPSPLTALINDEYGSIRSAATVEQAQQLTIRGDGANRYDVSHHAHLSGGGGRTRNDGEGEGEGGYVGLARPTAVVSEESLLLTNNKGTNNHPHRQHTHDQQPPRGDHSQQQQQLAIENQRLRSALASLETENRKLTRENDALAKLTKEKMQLMQQECGAVQKEVEKNHGDIKYYKSEVSRLNKELTKTLNNCDALKLQLLSAHAKIRMLGASPPTPTKRTSSRTASASSITDGTRGAGRGVHSGARDGGGGSSRASSASSRRGGLDNNNNSKNRYDGTERIRRIRRGDEEESTENRSRSHRQTSTSRRPSPSSSGRFATPPSASSGGKVYSSFSRRREETTSANTSIGGKSSSSSVFSNNRHDTQKNSTSRRADMAIGERPARSNRFATPPRYGRGAEDKKVSGKDRSSSSRRERMDDYYLHDGVYSGGQRSADKARSSSGRRSATERESASRPYARNKSPRTSSRASTPQEGERSSVGSGKRRAAPGRFDTPPRKGQGLTNKKVSALYSPNNYNYLQNNNTNNKYASYNYSSDGRSQTSERSSRANSASSRRLTDSPRRPPFR